VRFELTEQTRQALDDYLSATNRKRHLRTQDQNKLASLYSALRAYLFMAQTGH
jgi:hypothetical protein